MSVITGLARPKATVEASGSPTIYNVSSLLADTEYFQALTNNTKQFLVRVRGTSVLKLAFVVGESGINYITIPPGCTYEAVGLSFSGTLYFQTTKAAQIIEIIEWS